MNDATFDLAVIGGGVNGCGVARDAAGRGLSVFLCEQGDLAQATSSASTKLFHGGLRYLEYWEFRLVREALIERETLLAAMPHIAWPLRFVLPHHQGLRSAWLLRLGLFVYDHLAKRRVLPGTAVRDLGRDPEGAPLRDDFSKGFEYSDCWVQDSRLVLLNARDLEKRGGQVAVGTRCIGAEREGGRWRVTLEDVETGARRVISAKAVVNAGGPWVAEIAGKRAQSRSTAKIRLVRGSHIVLPKLYEHDKAYIFQNKDGRIIFAIPFEDDFTLLGTTDRDHEGPASAARCTDEEADYICAAASEYFKDEIRSEQILWRFAGVRPLYDDGAKSATAATRDYVLEVEDAAGAAALLNIYGGKITTYRKLAEAALEKLRPYFPAMGPAWTAGATLPGGDFPIDGAGDLEAKIRSRYAFVDEAFARRLVRAYGTDSFALLGDAARFEDLGRHFGYNLTEAEVRWWVAREWARTAEDGLWRRSKLGLRLSAEEADAVGRWMAQARAGGAAA